MKATVLYYSHTGRTAAYARDMAMYLWSKGFDVSLSSISDFDKSRLKQTDILLSGCWTCGWFIIGQHPHKKWKEFSKDIKGVIPENRIMLFTTYKIRTGSMESAMKKAIGISGNGKPRMLKSKTGMLSDNDKIMLDEFIKGIS